MHPYQFVINTDVQCAWPPSVMSAAPAAALNPGTQTPENESASVVPGSASGSRGHPARDRHWLTTDFDNMRCAELRRAAVALGVKTDGAAVAGQGTSAPPGPASDRGAPSSNRAAVPQKRMSKLPDPVGRTRSLNGGSCGGTTAPATKTPRGRPAGAPTTAPATQTPRIRPAGVPAPKTA